MVKVLFDTSVLVAAFLVNHPRHDACAAWLERAKSQEIAQIVQVPQVA